MQTNSRFLFSIDLGSLKYSKGHFLILSRISSVLAISSGDRKARQGERS